MILTLILLAHAKNYLSGACLQCHNYAKSITYFLSKYFRCLFSLTCHIDTIALPSSGMLLALLLLGGLVDKRLKGYVYFTSCLKAYFLWKAIVDKIVTAKIDFDLDFRAID